MSEVNVQGVDELKEENINVLKAQERPSAKTLERILESLPSADDIDMGKCKPFIC